MHRPEVDEHISLGFDAGNYANAYETTDYEHAIACLSPNRSAEYVAAFTLGFFASYERSELGSSEDAWADAFALVGERAVAAGYIDDEPEECEDNDCAGCAWCKSSHSLSATVSS